MAIYDLLLTEGRHTLAVRLDDESVTTDEWTVETVTGETTYASMDYWGREHDTSVDENEPTVSFRIHDERPSFG